MSTLLPALILGFPAYWILLARSAMSSREGRVSISRISARTIRRQLLMSGLVMGLIFAGLLVDFWVYERSDFAPVAAFPAFYGGMLLGAGFHFMVLKKPGQ